MSQIQDVQFPPASWEGSPDNWPTNWQHDDELGPWVHANVGDARSYILDTVDDWPDGQGLTWHITFPILRPGHYGMDSSTTSYSIWIDGVSNGAFFGLTVYSGATEDGRPYIQFNYSDADGQTGTGTDAIFDDGWSVGNEGWVRLRRDGPTLRLEYTSADGQNWIQSADIRSFLFGNGSGGWRVRFAGNYANNWYDLKGFSLSGTAQSLLWMADTTGTFVKVGTPAAPLRVAMPDGTWRRFDGSSDARLRMRMPDGTWKIVIG